MIGGTLSREAIEGAFAALDAELGRRDFQGQVYVLGGAVFCLVFRSRESTKDVDAWFTPPTEIRSAAKAVAEELGLPEDWLNDAAKAFLPEGATFESWRRLPHLEILVADAPTLLAMKCAAARTAEDAGDIRVLAEHLGLKSSAEILEAVGRFYPEDRLPVRTRLLLQELFP